MIWIKVSSLFSFSFRKRPVQKRYESSKTVAEAVYDNNGCKNFLIDLSLVKYCDSSGLSALLVGNRIIKEKEGSLNIFGLNPMVEKIISISQLDTVFNISNNEETALKNIP